MVCRTKLFLLVESLLFIGSGAGAGEKKYPDPAKKRTGSTTLVVDVLEIVKSKSLRVTGTRKHANSVADPHLLPVLCGSGTRIQNMSIWILGG